MQQSGGKGILTGGGAKAAHCSVVVVADCNAVLWWWNLLQCGELPIADTMPDQLR